MIHSHKEIFMVIDDWDNVSYDTEFDTYEDALLYAIDSCDRFSIKKLYVRV